MESRGLLEVEARYVARSAKTLISSSGAARRRADSPSPLTGSQLQRVFWEAFTAGDIGFAPDPPAVDQTSPECAAYQHEAAVSRERDLPLLQTAHNEICRLLDRSLGPLLWSPRQRRTVPVRDGVKLSVPFAALRPGMGRIRAVLALGGDSAPLRPDTVPLAKYPDARLNLATAADSWVRSRGAH